MKRHVSIEITGTVQGVFFRASTKKKADELNIKGRVRNQPDGTVYVEAEGDDEDLTRFVDWCHHGPPGASVEKVDVAEAPVEGFATFTIDR